MLAMIDSSGKGCRCSYAIVSLGERRPDRQREDTYLVSHEGSVELGSLTFVRDWRTIHSILGGADPFGASVLGEPLYALAPGQAARLRYLDAARAAEARAVARELEIERAEALAAKLGGQSLFGEPVRPATRREGHVAIDSNDCPPELVGAMVSRGLLSPSGLSCRSGFCSYELAALTPQPWGP